jgi:hypothetical protein
MQMLVTLLVCSLSTAGLAIFVRACPWPRKWTEVKPLACPVCMSGWSAFACVPLAVDALEVSWSWSMYVVAWFVSVCIGALVFNTIYPPPLALPGES